MKYVAIICLVFLGLESQAQLRINGVGVGFDFNGSGTMRSASLINLVTGSNADLFDPDNRIFMDRFLTSYSLTLSNPERDFFALEFDFMQGFENLYGSDYSWTESNDTGFSNSVYFDAQGSTLGLRGMAKFRTPSKNRWHFSFGIGSEWLYTYGVRTTANSNVSVSHWPSSYYFSETNRLPNNAIGNYQSVNLIQQVGLAFRLGKDEKSFPLNNTYIEADFQILSNFTNIEDALSTYRGYGGSFSIIYEFR